ncbi:hypothetical protein MPTK1_4g20930 [Marchantia polymorpha subsp. ruderalis]|uniref:Uncharacterized protein n=2 Tax=Marchantia polymorpha TaxID=3197 RepID=A0A176VP60_MARPO|nr:hypothetical protein AXG93_939s1130 [Marchantia polymorpha subsp. ruderalis]PTQ32247.1 hypothetical protein MARPO_0101s0039 [Marchantia polymorpha]BBN09589.1 hypothetical protein Mp_4g20930 [Marchantia polymorpha subsp. ruderalis]|eukprot:PTQ32247.1 hypothetical protein MARPO_0101s0039 [Marchantia polymorpha]
MEAMASLRGAGVSTSTSCSKQQFFAGAAPSPALVSCNKWSSAGGERRAVVSVEAKGRKTSMLPGSGRRPSGPNLPNLDGDDNPKFVLFIRTQKVPRWYPLSVVSGGSTAKVMLAAMGNDWGKKLYGDTLTRNIAEVIYKDERAVRQTAFKTYPVLKSASGFEYGYKIVDKKNPNSAIYGQDVIQIPPKGELKSVVDKVKESFGNLFTGVKDTFGSISPIEPEDAPEADKK